MVRASHCFSKCRYFIVLLFLIFFHSAQCAFAQQSPARVFETQWPEIIHKMGPYGVRLPDEIPDVAKDGFSLIVSSYQNPENQYGQLLKKVQIKYLDSYLWFLVWQACHRKTGQEEENAQSKAICVISSNEEKSILEQAQKHLNATKDDSNIVGFWILDDYPSGNVLHTLEKIHELVENANHLLRNPRPTVCGFGGGLDYKKTPQDLAFTKTHEYFQRSIVNFSNKACDMVALYPYAENKFPDPNAIDWSMSDLVPYELVVLKRLGWDPAREPLIGFAQAFSYPWKPGKMNFVEPRYQDIVAQIEAYCKWGASAMLFYAWDDSVTDLNKHQAFNTPEMRRALVDGFSLCKTKYWTDAAVPR